MTKMPFFLNFLCLAMLDLSCCPQALSSCGEQGLLSSCSAWTSYCGAFSYDGAQILDSVPRGLSCLRACGTFPDQVLNPCPLHWQADSQSLDHQGRPGVSISESLPLPLLKPQGPVTAPPARQTSRTESGTVTPSVCPAGWGGQLPLPIQRSPRMRVRWAWPPPGPWRPS